MVQDDNNIDSQNLFLTIERRIDRQGKERNSAERVNFFELCQRVTHLQSQQKSNNILQREKALRKKTKEDTQDLIDRLRAMPTLKDVYSDKNDLSRNEQCTLQSLLPHEQIEEKARILHKQCVDGSQNDRNDLLCVQLPVEFGGQIIDLKQNCSNPIYSTTKKCVQMTDNDENCASLAWYCYAKGKDRDGRNNGEGSSGVKKDCEKIVDDEIACKLYDRAANRDEGKPSNTTLSQEKERIHQIRQTIVTVALHRMRANERSKRIKIFKQTSNELFSVASTSIQRMFRGSVGRRIALKRKSEKKVLAALNFLVHELAGDKITEETLNEALSYKVLKCG